MIVAICYARWPSRSRKQAFGDFAGEFTSARLSAHAAASLASTALARTSMHGHMSRAHGHLACAGRRAHTDRCFASTLHVESVMSALKPHE